MIKIFKKEKVYTKEDLASALDKFLDAEDKLQMFNYEFSINKHKYRYAIIEYKNRLKAYKQIKKWFEEKEKAEIK